MPRPLSPSFSAQSFPENPEALLAKAAQPTLEKLRRHQQRVSPKLQPMLNYLEQHLFDPTLNVVRWRQACGIRDNSAAIQFHQEIGLPPKAFLSQLRLETSARLLMDSDLRLWQIAHLIGYSSLGVFSKAFHRWAGQRPNAYRRQVRSLDSQKKSPHWSQAEFLKRAITGELTADEAQELFTQLLSLYPTSVMTEAETDTEGRTTSAALLVGAKSSLATP